MKCSHVLLALALVLGCTDADKPECVQICEAAAACSMLPSALGVADNEGIIKHTAIDNCEQRCANSSGRTIQRLAACIGTRDVGDNWCMFGCDEVANCFEQVFEDPRVIGRGRVEVEFVSFSGQAIAPAMTCNVDSVSTDDVGDGSEITSITDFCNPDGYVIESVEILLENNEFSQVISSGSCSTVLADSFTSDLLPVGRYQLAIQLYRIKAPDETIPGSMPEASCHKFYGTNVLVSAGADVCDDGSCSGVIPLPPEIGDHGDEIICNMIDSSAGFGCELPTQDDACDDTKDNDCDNLKDCDDPSCASACVVIDSGTESGTDSDTGTDTGTSG